MRSPGNNLNTKCKIDRINLCIALFVYEAISCRQDRLTFPRDIVVLAQGVHFMSLSVNGAFQQSVSFFMTSSICFFDAFNKETVSCRYTIANCRFSEDSITLVVL